MCWCWQCTNLLASSYRFRSVGLTIAFDALGGTYAVRCRPWVPLPAVGPALLHRIPGAGMLDNRAQNGAIATYLAIYDSAIAKPIFDTGIAGNVVPIIA